MDVEISRYPASSVPLARKKRRGETKEKSPLLLSSSSSANLSGRAPSSTLFVFSIAKASRVSDFSQENFGFVPQFIWTFVFFTRLHLLPVPVIMSSRRNKSSRVRSRSRSREVRSDRADRSDRRARSHRSPSGDRDRDASRRDGRRSSTENDPSLAEALHSIMSSLNVLVASSGPR